MIFVDSNIPMYIVGAPHSNKDLARRLLERHIRAGDRLCTGAEVFQEILHRYVAIDRPEAIGPAFGLLRAAADEILSVEFSDVDRARELLLSHRGLSSRDALHAAVMWRHGIRRILSFDKGFDILDGVQRISE